MAELRYSLFLLFFITNYSQAMQNEKVVIKNNLSECIKMGKPEITYSDNIPMLSLSYQQLKPTSECGCKSAISQYSTQLEMDGYMSPLLTAKFQFRADKLLLPLATSSMIIGNYSLLVSFSCSLPD